MRIHIFTLFPQMFPGALDQSILGRARANGLLDVRLHNIRDHAHGPHRTVDDYPYGGGPGMVMKPDPLFRAVESAFGGVSPGFPVNITMGSAPSAISARELISASTNSSIIIRIPMTKSAFAIA